MYTALISQLDQHVNGDECKKRDEQNGRIVTCRCGSFSDDWHFATCMFYFYLPLWTGCVILLQKIDSSSIEIKIKYQIKTAAFDTVANDSSYVTVLENWHVEEAFR